MTCTATDPDDTNSPVQSTFTVMVQGAAQQLTALLPTVTGIGPGASLHDKVQQVLTSLQAHDTADACGTLKALINQVNAQSGKHLTSAQASQIVVAAT